MFIDGELAGIELLNCFETFKKNHSKLVQSYVMDALEKCRKGVKGKPETSEMKAGKVLELAATAAVEKTR